MKTMTEAKKATSVGVTEDELTKAMESAQAHIQGVYVSGRKTLVDEISTADWKAWDATNETALVADSGDIDVEDTLDDDVPLPKAA
jgi:hypothetical protein